MAVTEWEVPDWMAPHLRFVRWTQGHHPTVIVNGSAEDLSQWREIAVRAQLELLESLHEAGWLRVRPRHRP